MKKNRFPKDWDEKRVARVLAHYESQSDEEQVAEDEPAFKDRAQAIVTVPVELLPLIREIIAQHKSRRT